MKIFFQFPWKSLHINPLQLPLHNIQMSRAKRKTNPHQRRIFHRKSKQKHKFIVSMDILSRFFVFPCSRCFVLCWFCYHSWHSLRKFCSFCLDTNKASINFKKKSFLFYSELLENKTRDDVDATNFRWELKRALRKNIENPLTGNFGFPRNISMS